MKNYYKKDGMLMIYRAFILFIILLVICFVGYMIRSAVVKQRTQKDLEEVSFIINDKGDITKIL